MLMRDLELHIRCVHKDVTSSGGTCTDSSPSLHYEVTDNGIVRRFIAVDVDSDSNIINLTAATDGSWSIDV